MLTYRHRVIRMMVSRRRAREPKVATIMLSEPMLTGKGSVDANILRERGQLESIEIFK